MRASISSLPFSPHEPSTGIVLTPPERPPFLPRLDFFGVPFSGALGVVCVTQLLCALYASLFLRETKAPASPPPHLECGGSDGESADGEKGRRWYSMVVDVVRPLEVLWPRNEGAAEGARVREGGDGMGERDWTLVKLGISLFFFWLAKRYAPPLHSFPHASLTARPSPQKTHETKSESYIGIVLILILHTRFGFDASQQTWTLAFFSAISLAFYTGVVPVLLRVGRGWYAEKVLVGVGERRGEEEGEEEERRPLLKGEGTVKAVANRFDVSGFGSRPRSRPPSVPPSSRARELTRSDGTNRSSFCTRRSRAWSSNTPSCSSRRRGRPISPVRAAPLSAPHPWLGARRKALTGAFVPSHSRHPEHARERGDARVQLAVRQLQSGREVVCVLLPSHLRPASRASVAEAEKNGAALTLTDDRPAEALAAAAILKNIGALFGPVVSGGLQSFLLREGRDEAGVFLWTAVSVRKPTPFTPSSASRSNAVARSTSERTTDGRSARFHETVMYFRLVRTRHFDPTPGIARGFCRFSVLFVGLVGRGGIGRLFGSQLARVGDRDLARSCFRRWTVWMIEDLSAGPSLSSLTSSGVEEIVSD